MKKTTVLCFMLLLVILSGCIKIPIGDGNSLKITRDGVSVSNSDGKESTMSIDKDNETMTISNEDGEEWAGTFGEDVDLPKEFPVEDFPTPKGAKIISAQSMSMDEGDGMIVVYMSEGDLEELADMYVKHYQDGDYEEVEDGTLGEVEDIGFLTVTAEKNEKMYIVQLMSSGDNEVQVVLMYGENDE